MMRWMIYVIVVTLILCIAALAAERALRLRRAATRWVWIAAIVGSLVVPTIMSTVSFQVPNIRTASAPQRIVVLRNLTSLPLEAITGLPEAPLTWNARKDLDSQLERFWWIASGAMVLLLAASAVQLFWRKRRWARATIAGRTVYTAPQVGPAVVGLLNPHIVVPPWVIESSPACQALVIAHEQEHVSARDPQLLTTALCMIVFMPWNLPLWWALRRLRHAMEVDCDARVLQAGHDATRYAETLIDVGERQSSFLGSVAAMSESSSRLEQRLQIMLRKPHGWWKTTAVLLAGLTVCLIGVAAQVSPPNSSDPARTAGTANTELYGNYVGYYQLESSDIIVIRRDGERMTGRMLGQGAIEFFPTGATGEFFARAVSARLTFDTDAQGHATALILHQGKDFPAPRMDDAMGKRIADALDARVRAQTANPGSEAALRRLYAGQLAGKPAIELMSPGLANVARQQVDDLKKSAVQLGNIQSIEFRGVGDNGYDVYFAKHEHALVTWRILMLSPDGSGVVQAIVFHTGP